VVRFAKIAVALLCITCVLALCIAPYVDIPFTVLKALQDVVLLMFSLLTGVLLLVSLFHHAPVRFVPARWRHTAVFPSILPPLETNCVQRC
jgi:hypothetical protein